MSLDVHIADLEVRHGSTRAIDGASLRVRPGSICGLFGRNGAGKTSLLLAMAAYLRPAAGSLRVGGRDPYEDPALMASIAYVPSARKADGDLKVQEVIDIVGTFRPTFAPEVADRLLDRFELPRKATVGKLSTGQRSAFTASIGLASRAPLTLFDETHQGMDAVARAAFYEEVLVEYAEQPRTIVLSTHLLDEVATMLDDVVVLDRGRVLQHRTPEELQAMGARLTGPDAAVEAMAQGMRILSRQHLGRTTSLVVFAPLDAAAREHAADRGVAVEPLPLQDLFVALTTEEVAA
jgi:ABC-2 type transport system ATP-binding protein